MSSQLPGPVETLRFAAAPFHHASLRDTFDVDNTSYVELQARSQLFKAIVGYVIHLQKEQEAKGKVNSKDVIISYNIITEENADLDPITQKPRRDRNRLTMGLGLHKIEFEDSPLHILHQQTGPPVGSECGIQQLRSIVIFAPNDNHQEDKDGESILKRFCEMLIEWYERNDDEDSYTVFQWDPEGGYWDEIITKRIRPVESVILPTALKQKVLEDVDSFAAEETAKWYADHGISYKRSYLFHGPPGAGKTSFIRVLAGHLGRNLCYLHLSHPAMTDESLQLSFQRAPGDCIIVIEDVDALFETDRSTKSEKCPLSFSGLLNGLDGIANRDGQIFVLTTNHIEKLDKALIRPGRVDLRVEFSNVKAEQVKGMFLHFYPKEVELAEKFASEIVKRFGVVGGEEGQLNGDISMAALQQHFILCRTKTSAEAVAELTSFDLIWKSLVEERELEKELKEKAKAKALKEQEELEKEEQDEKEKEKEEKEKEKEKVEEGKKEEENKEKELALPNGNKEEELH